MKTQNLGIFKKTPFLAHRSSDAPQRGSRFRTLRAGLAGKNLYRILDRQTLVNFHINSPLSHPCGRGGVQGPGRPSTPQNGVKIHYLLPGIDLEQGWNFSIFFGPRHSFFLEPPPPPHHCTPVTSLGSDIQHFPQRNLQEKLMKFLSDQKYGLRSMPLADSFRRAQNTPVVCAKLKRSPLDTQPNWPLSTNHKPRTLNPTTNQAPPVYIASKGWGARFCIRLSKQSTNNRLTI